MQLSRAAFVFIVAAVSIPVFAAQNADAKKTTKKAKVASATSSRHYFVPPPPPYVPNLMPSASAYSQYYFGTASTKPKQNTVESMYGKYVYTRPGYTAPQPVQQNKYVTVWSKL
jgi:hypothetical protein